MGTAILAGITGGETMLVQGVVIVVALAFVIINIVVDMLYPVSYTHLLAV